jgi:hypothetical protein
MWLCGNITSITINHDVFTKYSLVGITNKKCIDYKLYQKGTVNSKIFKFHIEVL